MVRLNARALALTTALVITPAVAGCGYNTIPTQQERAEAAWADVQSQYQRRADLVPNLVATVQGAAIQERTTLTDVINARARATSVNISADDLDNPQAFQQYQQAQGQLSGALSRLLVSVEAVRAYNTTLRTFPNVIWAKTLHAGSQPMQLFTATAEAQSAPQVDFNLGAPPSNASAAPGGTAAPVAPGATPPAQ